jgi:hypothetical protein
MFLSQVLAARARGKTKTPPPVWQWGDSFQKVTSTPDCRSAQQQSLDSQQPDVHVQNHRPALYTPPWGRVNLVFFHDSVIARSSDGD